MQLTLQLGSQHGHGCVACQEQAGARSVGAAISTQKPWKGKEAFRSMVLGPNCIQWAHMARTSNLWPHAYMGHGIGSGPNAHVMGAEGVGLSTCVFGTTGLLVYAD